MKSPYERETCTSMFIVGLFTIAQMRNQPKCPSTYERIKESVTQWEYHSATKKNEIMSFAAKCMKLEDIVK
jgi:hypothetical protein